MRGRRRAGPLRGGVQALGARTPDARVRRLPPRGRDRLGQWRSRPSRQPVRPGRDAGAVLDHVPAAHRVLGVRYTRREADAVLHLWCYVGWLMGVDRRWLPFDERAGLRMMYQIGASSPAADEHSYALAASLVDLPLHTHYPRFQRLRRRYQYERGLSLATTLLGPAGVRALRVPVRPPWYPLARLAVNVPKHHVLARFPAGRPWVQRLGERRLEQAAQRILDGEIPDVVALPD
ncbi:DUF2236 domain-containing protein [Rhodococcus hoagii]|nr:DUF2236 domain-containing protein [Prescottella equi]